MGSNCQRGSPKINRQLPSPLGEVLSTKKISGELQSPWISGELAVSQSWPFSKLSHIFGNFSHLLSLPD